MLRKSPTKVRIYSFTQSPHANGLDFFSVPPAQWSDHVANEWRDAQTEAELDPDIKHTSKEIFAAMPWLAEWRDKTRAATIDFRVDQGTFPANVNKVTALLTKIICLPQFSFHLRRDRLTHLKVHGSVRESRPPCVRLGNRHQQQ